MFLIQIIVAALCQRLILAQGCPISSGGGVDATDGYSCMVNSMSCDNIKCVMAKELNISIVQFNFSSCVNLTSIQFKNNANNITVTPYHLLCSPSDEQTLTCNQTSCTTLLNVSNSTSSISGQIDFHILTGQSFLPTTDKLPNQETSQPTTVEAEASQPTDTTSSHVTTSTSSVTQFTSETSMPADIPSTITGATVAIGSLLFLVVLAITGLMLVILIKKKKSPSMTSDPFDNTGLTPGGSGTMSSYGMSTLPTPPYSEGGTGHHVGSSLGAEAGLGLPRRDFTLPIPPMEPGLVTLAEWQQDQENMQNPLYVSTLSVASSEDQLQSPDYEAVHDAKRKFRFEMDSEGLSPLSEHSAHPSSRSLLPLKEVEGEPEWDTSGGLKDTSNSTGRPPIVIEEGEMEERRSSQNSLTAENCLYGSFEEFSASKEFESSQDHSVHNDLYSTAADGEIINSQRNRNDKRMPTSGHGSLEEDYHVVTDEGETSTQDESIDNDLYENVSSCKDIITSQYSVIGEDLYLAGKHSLSKTLCPRVDMLPAEVVTSDLNVSLNGSLAHASPSVSPIHSSTSGVMGGIPTGSDTVDEDVDQDGTSCDGRDPLYSAVNKRRQSSDKAPPVPPYLPHRDSTESNTAQESVVSGDHLYSTVKKSVEEAPLATPYLPYRDSTESNTAHDQESVVSADCLYSTVKKSLEEAPLVTPYLPSDSMEDNTVEEDASEMEEQGPTPSLCVNDYVINDNISEPEIQEKTSTSIN